jgi:glycosyltransferase involved in cell wall biosynthesis
VSNNTEKVSVSFIVIAYNEREKIATALASLLNQETNKKFEIIVVDDGSTDNTVQAAREGMANFPRQQIISFPSNRGRGAARLEGQMRATGEYLAFIDSDVALPTNWVERAWSEVENEGLDAVSGIAIPDGDCVVIARIGRLEPKTRGGSAALTGNNLFIKREVIARVPFQNIPYGDDIRLAWDLEIAGYKTRSISDLVVNHAESKSFKRTAVWQYQQGKEATALLWDYRKFRVPDLAWFGSLFVAIFSFFLLRKTFKLEGAILCEVSYCILVSLIFLYSRFYLKFFSDRVYLAIVVNSIFMASYFAGRFVGVFQGSKKKKEERINEI